MCTRSSSPPVCRPRHCRPRHCRRRTLSAEPGMHTGALGRVWHGRRRRRGMALRYLWRSGSSTAAAVLGTAIAVCPPAFVMVGRRAFSAADYGPIRFDRGLAEGTHCTCSADLLPQGPASGCIGRLNKCCLSSWPIADMWCARATWRSLTRCIDYTVEMTYRLKADQITVAASVGLLSGIQASITRAVSDKALGTAQVVGRFPDRNPLVIAHTRPPR